MEARVIKRNGEVVEKPNFDFMLSTLGNGEYVVRINRKTKARSLPQNSLMWMWFQCMEDATGQPKEDFHDYYKSKFLLREVKIGDNISMVPMSTTSLNTIQMTNYLEKIQADAATEFGITLPLPEDMTYQDFIDYYKYR